MPKGLAYTGYIIALIGGIILIVDAALGLLRVTFRLPSLTVLDYVRFAERDTITLILGIIAAIGARYVDYLGWAIGLIIIGLITSGSIGGLLVLVGGILGLVHRLNKPR